MVLFGPRSRLFRGNGSFLTGSQNLGMRGIEPGIGGWGFLLRSVFLCFDPLFGRFLFFGNEPAQIRGFLLDGGLGGLLGGLFRSFATTAFGRIIFGERPFWCLLLGLLLRGRLRFRKFIDDGWRCLYLLFFDVGRLDLLLGDRLRLGKFIDNGSFCYGRGHETKRTLLIAFVLQIERQDPIMMPKITAVGHVDAINVIGQRLFARTQPFDQLGHVGIKIG